MSDMVKQAQIFDKILKKEENKLCADCRRKSPSWASLNLGVLICMKCSDNKIANEYWESKLKDLNYEKIQNDDYKLHDLIKDKYERKKYCDPKKTDPMTLIVQGKTLQKADDSFRDVEEDFVASSDEDRSAYKKKRKDLGFKVISDSSNNNNNKITAANSMQEPLFQINNTNSSNLISFDQSENNNANNAKDKFSFISKNNKSSALQNTNNTNNNNNLNFLINNTNQNNNVNNNNNNNNNLFNVNSSSNNGNSDLMDLKSSDKFVDEKLKKITDNIEELYKNPNNFNLSNVSASNGFNSTQNKQNDLFNALNPQLNSKNMNMNYANMHQHQQQGNNNMQNNYYNNNNNNYANNNQQAQFNYLNNNNNNSTNNSHFYGNGMNLGINNVNGIGSSGFNSGYGANYAAKLNMNVNHQQQQMSYSNYNNNNNNQRMNNVNNFNSGFLTANDIYMKKDETVFNLNYNGQSNGNKGNANFLEFSEVKPKKNEDPFSNLVSFK